MSKSALGRGLSDLLGRTETVPGEAPPLESPETAPAPAPSPGVSRLLRGETVSSPADIPAPEQPPPAPIPAPARTHVARRKDTDARVILAQWAMGIADVLLIVLAFWIAERMEGRFGALEVCLVTGALAIGAILACLAWSLDREG